MELFQNAKAVRLKSIYNKYLTADEDEETVLLDRNGASKSAKWTVEYVGKSDNIIRLKSCYNKYLTALDHPYLLGTAGKKVVQTPSSDSSVEWEPVAEGNNRMKLKTRSGQFLRANGGLPPWRNSVTHDIPHRTAMQDTVVWEVHVLEIILKSPAAAQPPPPPPRRVVNHSDITSSESAVESPLTFPKQVPTDDFGLLRSESKGNEGRLIYYRIANQYGEVDEEWEEMCITFKGNGVVDELAKSLEKETELKEIVVCTKSPLNGRLYPLHLHLPPNNATMHVVVVPSAIKVARGSVRSLRTLA